MISPGRAWAAALSEGSDIPGLIPSLPGRGERREGNRAGTKAAWRVPQQHGAVPVQASAFPVCATFPTVSPQRDSQTASLCSNLSVTYAVTYPYTVTPTLWLSNTDQGKSHSVGLLWILSSRLGKNCAKLWCLQGLKKKKYIIYVSAYIYKICHTGTLRRQLLELSR